MLAHWHKAWVGRDRVIFAAVEYPETNPPEEIHIGGITYVRRNEKAPRERGERKWTEADS